MSISLGIGLKIGGNGGASWTPDTPLGGETPDLWVKEGTRSGLTLPDTINPVTNDANIIVPALTNYNSNPWIGDKTRAEERLFDGGSYTIFCEITQMESYNAAGGKILMSLGGLSTQTRGLYMQQSYGGIYIYNGDAVLAQNNVILIGTEPPTDCDALTLPLDVFYFYCTVNFATKVLYAGFFNEAGNLIGTALNRNITTFTFEDADNSNAYSFNAVNFALSNFKKFNTIKTLADCRTITSDANLQLYYPDMVSGTDVSGNARHLTCSGVRGYHSKTYVKHNYTWLLDHGYSMMKSYLEANTLVHYIPNTYAGVTIDRTAQDVNYKILNEVAGDLTNHNLTDCKIRLVDAFFDRSNVTIWSDKARIGKSVYIMLTGTSGTATVTVNGVANTATWHTSLTVTASDFVTANAAAYLAANAILTSHGAFLSFEATSGDAITDISIANASLTLNGIVNVGYYDVSHPKDFHISELDQRTIYEYLNTAYRARFFIKAQSENYLGTFNSSITESRYFDPHGTRKKLLELFLYTTDKTLLDHSKALTYTGDIHAAIKDVDGLVTYDAQDHIPLGYFKATKPLMIVRFDDGFDTQYEDFFPLCESLGIKATIAILTGTDDGGDYMEVPGGIGLTWPEIVALQTAEWEILNHGRDDDDLSLNTPAEALAAIIYSKDRLISFGLSVKHFAAHKNGGFAAHVAIAAMKYYGSATTVNELLNPEQIQLDYISTLRGDISGSYNLDVAGGVIAFKAKIDEAVANNRIIITYLHSYSADKGAGLTDVVNYAIAAGVEITTLSGALSKCRYLALV